MSEIDPVQFGALTGQVQALEKRVGELNDDVKQLLELANKSRGGFWAGMAIASSLGAIVSWVAGHAQFFK